MPDPEHDEDGFVPFKRPAVVDMAFEVLDMYHRIQLLEKEAAEGRYYRREFNKLLNESIDHSRHMMGSILGALIDPDSAISMGLAAKAKEAHHG